MQVAAHLKELENQLGITILLKASFDKGNRSSIKSYRGLGMEKGLQILEKAKTQFQLPLVTDIHESYQAQICQQIIDVIQIPAFLCRQTDLLLAAAQTDRVVNIKKGQFLAGSEMINVVRKIETLNDKLLLTERGNSFGYGNLVVDYRNLIEMQQFGYPVIFDATHSTQKPGALGTSSGGDRQYSLPLALAAAAIGVHGFFMEVHPEPENALSDKENCLKLSDLQTTLSKVLTIFQAQKQSKVALENEM